jgi:hypothetical protein
MRIRLILVVMIAATLAPAGCDRVSPPGEKIALPPPQQIGPAIAPAEPVAPAAEQVNPNAAGQAAAQMPPVPEPVDPPKRVDADQEIVGSTIPGPTGRIVGMVTFEGVPIPTPTVVTNDKDTECCGAKIKTQDIVISAENRGIMNVIAWVEDVKLPDGYKPPRQTLRLAAQRCQFRQRAYAMTVGSPIDLTTADPIEHAIQLSGAQDEVVRLKNRGEEYSTEARHAGMLHVKCEDHDWMATTVRVDPHPFHDVTDVDGKFVIAGVPVGDYKLKAWHEKFGEQVIDVAIRAGETVSLKIQYPPKKGAATQDDAGKPPVKRQTRNRK